MIGGLVTLGSAIISGISGYFQDKNEIKSRNYIWTALNNVRDSATNTTTRLGGSYYSEGVISALVNPSTRPERIESLLTA